MRATYLAHLVFLHLITVTIFDEDNNYEALYYATLSSFLLFPLCQAPTFSLALRSEILINLYSTLRLRGSSVQTCMVYGSGYCGKCTSQFSFYAQATEFMCCGVMIMNWSRMEGKKTFSKTCELQNYSFPHPVCIFSINN
jgi:hypothetical protein